MSRATIGTAATLAAIGGLHVAWGRGSTFPFGDAGRLADTVAGTESVPAPVACYATAGLLLAAAGLVAGGGMIPTRVQRLGVGTAATVLAVRGVLGVGGQTHRLIGSANSSRFVAYDRVLYGPLCLLLAAGAASSLR